LTSPSLQSLAKNQLTLALQIDKALSQADNTTPLDLPPLKPFHHRSTTPSHCPPPESPSGPGLASQTDTKFLRKKISQSNITAAMGPGGIDFDAGSRGTLKTESVLDLGIEEDCQDTLVQMNDALSQLQAWKQEQQVKEAALMKVTAAQQKQFTAKEESSDVNNDDLATTDGFASFEDGGYYSGTNVPASKQPHGLEIADQCILDLMKRRRDHCEERAAQRQELDAAKAGAASNLNPGLLKLQSDLLGLKLKEFGLQAADSVDLPTSRPNIDKGGTPAGTLEMDDYDIDLEDESWDRFVTEEEKVNPPPFEAFLPSLWKLFSCLPRTLLPCFAGDLFTHASFTSSSQFPSRLQSLSFDVAPHHLLPHIQQYPNSDLSRPALAHSSTSFDNHRMTVTPPLHKTH
jgi:hypothetical protein